ncbi:MAG: nitroreductase family protein [Dehalococcoidales bacterium]|nr:nitroreductase family protein [Dehalococcoidales bacterium]
MLSVKEAIENRRSIRRFLPDDIPDDLIKQILEAARLAPSASNRQPWRFLVIRAKETKRELRHICLDQHFIEEAPVVVVCFGDLDMYSKTARRQRRREMLSAGVSATASGRFADPAYIAHLELLPTPPREQLLTPVTANAYIAIDHLVLMATALGLGTCWVAGFEDATAINRLFDLPDNLVPLVVVPIGYPAGKIPPPRPRRSLEDILFKVGPLTEEDSPHLTTTTQKPNQPG